MAIETEWFHQNHQIIWTRFTGDGSVEQLNRLASVMPAFLDYGEERLYWIVDFSDAVNPVTDMGAIRRALAFLTHPNLHMALVVGAPNSLFKFISSMVAQIYHTQYRNFETLDEAIAFLEEIDALPVSYKRAS